MPMPSPPKKRRLRVAPATDSDDGSSSSSSAAGKDHHATTSFLQGLKNAFRRKPKPQSQPPLGTDAGSNSDVSMESSQSNEQVFKKPADVSAKDKKQGEDEDEVPIKRVTRSQTRLSQGAGSPQVQQPKTNEPEKVQSKAGGNSALQRSASARRPPNLRRGQFDAKNVLSSMPGLASRYGFGSDGQQMQVQEIKSKPLAYTDLFKRCAGPQLSAAFCRKLTEEDLKLLYDETEQYLEACLQDIGDQMPAMVALHLRRCQERAAELGEDLPDCSAVGTLGTDAITTGFPLETIEQVQLYFLDYRNITAVTDRFYTLAMSNSFKRDDLNRTFISQTFSVDLQKQLCWERLDLEEARIRSGKPARQHDNCIRLPSMCQDWYRKLFGMVFHEAAVLENEEHLRVMFQNRRRRARSGQE